MTFPTLVLTCCCCCWSSSSLTLGIVRARLVGRPAELAALHLGRIHWFHHDGWKPLGQLWIPFVGFGEHLIRSRSRWICRVGSQTTRAAMQKIGLRSLCVWWIRAARLNDDSCFDRELQMCRRLKCDCFYFVISKGLLGRLYLLKGQKRCDSKKPKASGFFYWWKIYTLLHSLLLVMSRNGRFTVIQGIAAFKCLP